MQPNSFKMCPDVAPSGNRNLEESRNDSFQSKAIIPSGPYAHLYPVHGSEAEGLNRRAYDNVHYVPVRARDTASQVARRLSEQDIMLRYRMTVRCQILTWLKARLF